MKPIDLHVHSNKSDGSNSPEELVYMAMAKGLSAFALTDHDTVDGIDEALACAERLHSEYAAIAKSTVDATNAKEKSSTVNAADATEAPVTVNTADATEKPGTVNIAQTANAQNIPEVIPGIELSTEYQGKDIHLVGLYIDHRSAAFRAYLQEFVDSRTERNRKMCANLAAAGIDISYEKLAEAFPDSVLTRAHYAVYLVEHGYSSSKDQAFSQYLGDHTKYFVPREKITPEMGIELILKAGGIPILAHPVLYRMSDTRLDALVAHLKAAGLAGIEAIYATYSTAEERQMRKLAAKYDLCISGGSDYHGDAKPGLEMGTGYGRLFVPEDILKSLKALKHA